MTGGTVKNNKVTGSAVPGDQVGGGGMYLPCEAEISGGYIQNNTATNSLGGGIYSNSANGNIINGSVVVSGNSASYGGGIYHECDLDISAGTFSSNTASEAGGAIYAEQFFDLSGSAKFYTTSDAEKINDIYLCEGIYIADGSLSQTTVATITPEKWKRGTQILSTSSNNSRFKISDSEWSIVAYSSQGRIDADIYVAPTGSTTTVSGVTYGKGTASTAGGRGTKAKPYASISDAVSQCWGGSKDKTSTYGRTINIVGTLSGAQSIPSTLSTSMASTITLKGINTSAKIDRGLSSSAASDTGSALTINAPVPVRIQQLIITGGNTTGNGGGINVTTTGTNNKKLTIAANASITGNKADSGSGGGIYAGSFEITDGSITGNSAKWGGGVCASVVISGGEISGNTATETGGGVYGSSVTMTGGIVKNNSVSADDSDQWYGGGGIWGNYDIIISGGTIQGNSAINSFGGGIATYEGSIYIYDSAVIGDDGKTAVPDADSETANKAKCGGGISLNGADPYLYIGLDEENDEVEFTGSIAYNYASEKGGGVYYGFNNPVYIKSGSIKYNTAKNGGGVYSNDSIYMSGGNITGNKATAEKSTLTSEGGGGIFIKNNCLFMSGGKIAGNISTNNGGGVLLDEGLLYMTGDAVIGELKESPSSATNATNCSNYAAGFGGGVYCWADGVIRLGYKRQSEADNLAGGIYYNYSAEGGGGIYYNANDPLEFNTGNISYNGTAKNGGGVHMNNQDIKMTGGTIAGNYSAVNGGGIYLATDQNSLYMSGSSLIGDTGTGDTYSNIASYGGGVYVSGGCAYIGYKDFTHELAMTTGSYGIMHNKASTSGGGIYYKDSTPSISQKMASGYVSNNRAINGGGVYIGTNNDFYMYGGTMDANVTSASGKGGAIYLGGNFYIDNSAVIINGSLRSNDVYLYTNRWISIGDNFTGNTITNKCAITPYTYSSGITVLSGIDSKFDRFKLTNSSYTINATTGQIN